MMKATPEQQKAGMQAWQTWGDKARSSIVDAGGPLGKAMRVTPSASEAVRNDLGGYSILQAESKEALAASLKNHPHFQTPEGFIEITEVMPNATDLSGSRPNAAANLGPLFVNAAVTDRPGWAYEPCSSNPRGPMKTTHFMASALATSFLLFTHPGCAGSGTDASSATATPNSEDTVAANEDTLRLRFRRRRPPPPPTGTAGTGSGAAGAVSDPSCAAPTGDIDAIIKAAQTSDGAAIPQASLPGGCCPAVVAALGFWSCATQGDACTYSASGTTHHCTCNRVDGEGQLPAWVCD